MDWEGLDPQKQPTVPTIFSGEFQAFQIDCCQIGSSSEKSRKGESIKKITLNVGITLFGALVFAQNDAGSGDKNSRLNTILGKINVKNNWPSVLIYLSTRGKLPIPFPPTINCRSKFTPKKLLKECGCKQPEYEAQFMLTNKANAVVKGESLHVGTPDGHSPSYTMNVSTSLTNSMSPPLKLVICCSSAKNCK